MAFLAHAKGNPTAQRGRLDASSTLPLAAPPRDLAAN
jgi:hypothetical protein